MEKISTEDVEKLARLARLGLQEDEKAVLAVQMTEVLGYVEQLDEVDIDGVEPTSQVAGLKNIYIADKKQRCDIPREELLANAPEKEDGFIKVKPVLEDSGASL